MEANNMAAMRKALEFADRELRAATEDDRYGDDIVYLVGCMREVASACRAALSAPPRNCDRFRDWDSAEAEYERLVQEGKAEDGTWCEWLFSVGQYASAQEGSAK